MPDSVPITVTIDADGNVTLATLASLGITKGTINLTSDASGIWSGSVSHGLPNTPSNAQATISSYSGSLSSLNPFTVRRTASLLIFSAMFGSGSETSSLDWLAIL